MHLSWSFHITRLSFSVKNLEAIYDFLPICSPLRLIVGCYLDQLSLEFELSAYLTRLCSKTT